MTRPVFLRPKAADDLNSARDWYDRQQPGLGDKFAAQVAVVFGQLASMPELFAVQRHNVRVCQLNRFPYVIYYRVYTDRVQVLAVLHAGRDASAWQSPP